MRSPSSPVRSASLVLCLLVAAPMAHADERADALLREVERSTKSLASLGARLQVTLTTQNISVRPVDPQQPRQSDPGFGQGNEPVSFTYAGTVKLQRPNLERIDLLDPIRQTIASDGQSLWTLLPTHEYIKNPADPQGKSPSAYGPILMFFAPETARTGGVLPMPGAINSDDFATRYLGKERVVLKIAHSKQDPPGTSVGKETLPEEFDVIEVRQLRPTQLAMKLYINADKIVTRVVSETRRGGVSTIQDVSLLNLKPAQKFDPAEFAFELPADARPYVFQPAPARK
jgi:outer membrane lipoprotein-sorting protein